MTDIIQIDAEATATVVPEAEQLSPIAILAANAKRLEAAYNAAAAAAKEAAAYAETMRREFSQAAHVHQCAVDMRRDEGNRAREAEMQAARDDAQARQRVQAEADERQNQMTRDASRAHYLQLRGIGNMRTGI